VQGQTVLAAYSSGELFAIRTANGGVAWQDALSRTGRLTPLSSINDIDGEPVIAGDHVYAVSHGDRMVSIDLRTGARDWERNVSSIHTPWVAGDFIFLVTMDADLVALYRPDGQVRWILPLQKYVDVDDAKHLISWSGPILAGNRLIVVSSHGYVVSVSPYTGKIIGASRAADSLNIEPIVANKTLYVMDDGGTVYALR
jgi:outer membrane protein assembly factor BamB